MEIYQRIPAKNLGKCLDEDDIKNGLRALNRDIFFDVGGRLGMDHPMIQYRQGVFYAQRPPGRKHICSMDRNSALGCIPEVPIWRTMKDLVKVEWSDLGPGEIVVQTTMDGDPMVFREVPNHDFVIISGWRHTFDKLVGANIPGIDRVTLSNKFGVEFRNYVAPVTVPEEPHYDPLDMDDTDPELDLNLMPEWLQEYKAPPFCHLQGETSENSSDSSLTTSKEPTTQDS